MRATRAAFLLSMAASALAIPAQFPDEQRPRSRFPNDDHAKDEKLPNGKSRNDAIAKENHKQALEDAGEMVRLAKLLQDELEKAGDYVVPMNSVKRTEEMEKLARRIRSRLKG